MKTAIAFLACTMLVTPALADFKRAPPPPPFTDGYFECAILGHTAERDPPDPVYKINVNVGSDSAGKFNSMGIVHTVRSGRTYDRSEQYRQDDIWQTQGRMEWYWKGQRGNKNMVGELYHNERDGWMYSEQLFQNGRQTYSMLSDCHLMQAVGQNGVEQLPPTLRDAPSWLGKK